MSKKLLLADDSITIQKVIGITFANEDYHLTVVGDGDAALEKARAERPDLILADVFMPGKNGYELCSAAKEDPSLRGVPVLLLTGTFEPFDEGKAAAAGADGWIAKPFESQSLIDKVEDLLSRSIHPSSAESPIESVGPAAAEAPLEDDIWTDLPALAVPGEEDELLGIEEAFAPVEEKLEGGAISPASPEDDIWQSLGEELPADADGSPPFDFAEEEPSSAGVVDPFAEEGGAVSDDPFVPEEETVDSAVLQDTFSGLHPAQEWVAAAEPSEGETDGDEGVWDTFDDEEILALEESDILEDDLEIEEDGNLAAIVASMETENELPPVDLEEAEDALPPAELLWESGDEEEGGEEEDPGFLGAESFVDGAAGDFMAAEAVDEEGFFELDADGLVEDTEIGAPSLAAEESFASEDEYAFSLEEEQPLPSEAPRPSEEMIAPAALSLSTSADVEEKVSSLTEAELERIVEKVAGSVIERLAQTMLERIAWEVVPDLAESMIRDEIRKIREEVR